MSQYSWFFAVLNRPTIIDPEADPVESMRGELEFRRIDFSYLAWPDVPILKDVNVRIRAGQSQALVGASRSGKSTVIAFIERFYNPKACSICHKHI